LIVVSDRDGRWVVHPVRRPPHQPQGRDEEGVGCLELPTPKVAVDSSVGLEGKPSVGKGQHRMEWQHGKCGRPWCLRSVCLLGLSTKKKAELIEETGIQQVEWDDHHPKSQINGDARLPR